MIIEYFRIQLWKVLTLIINKIYNNLVMLRLKELCYNKIIKIRVIKIFILLIKEEQDHLYIHQD
jgi:hypothetical protein